MQRRSFLKAGGAMTLAAGIRPKPAHPKLNDDGTLTLRQTAGLGQEDETGGVPRGPQ